MLKLINFKKVLSVVSLGLCLSSGLALAAHNPCNNVAGTWHGKGELNFLFMKCNYNSVATVGVGNPSKAEVVIQKDSHNPFCPSGGLETVTVSCDNGHLQMKDSKLDISGYISDDEKSAVLEGSLYALYRYHPFKLTVMKAN